MDVAEYFKIKKRVCKSANYRCDECFMANCIEECCDLELNHPGETVSAMEQWAAEHPQKTIVQEFLEKYPDAPINNRGYPVKMCPDNLGYSRYDECPTVCLSGNICVECWNRSLEEAKE